MQCASMHTGLAVMTGMLYELSTLLTLEAGTALVDTSTLQLACSSSDVAYSKQAD